MKNPSKNSKKRYGIRDYDKKCRRSLNILLLPQDLMWRTQWHRAVNALKMATSWYRKQDKTELGFITLTLESEEALQNVRYVSEAVADKVARQLRRFRCRVKVGPPRVQRVGKSKWIYSLSLQISNLQNVVREGVVVEHFRLSRQVRSRGGMYNVNAPRLRRVE